MVVRSANDILGDEDRGAPSILSRYLRTDGITILGGPAESGKSSLLASIGAAVTVGGPTLPWAATTRRGPVLLLSSEEEARTVANPFKVLPAEVRKQIHIMCHSDLDKHRAGFMELIRKINPVLVVADPMDVLASPRQDPRRHLAPLLADIQAKGYAVVGVLHTLDGARLGGKLLKGSGDWIRLARSILYYGPDPRFDPHAPERRSILFHLKCNRGGERGAAQEFSESHGWLGTVENLALEHLLVRPEKRPMPAPANQVRNFTLGNRL